jgi:hypothetical protein
VIALAFLYLVFGFGLGLYFSGFCLSLVLQTNARLRVRFLQSLMNRWCPLCGGDVTPETECSACHKNARYWPLEESSHD